VQDGILERSARSNSDCGGLALFAEFALISRGVFSAIPVGVLEDVI
jgi:hypothetical protein